MVVMKHLLQQQQAGGPGSPPALKCHDRLPLVIAMVLLQRLKGTESHCTTIRHQALAHICTSPPPCCCPHRGRCQCRQGGQQRDGPGSTTFPCTMQGRCCPTYTTPNHPQQEASFRKLFKSLIALLNKSTHLFPADINLRDLSSPLLSAILRSHPQVSLAIFLHSCLP